MPANTEFFANNLGGAGSGPVLFTDGATVSGLSYTFTSLVSTTDNISFSNDNGASYDYPATEQQRLRQRCYEYKGIFERPA